MALNGYVTAEEKRARLIKTSRGFVVVIRAAHAKQDYEVFREGVRLGRVYRMDVSRFGRTMKAMGWRIEGREHDTIYTSRADAIEALAHGVEGRAK